MTLLLHVHKSLMHKYTITLDIITWILCAQLLHIFTPLLYRLTGIHTLIVFVFLLHGSLFILHELLLDGYSHIPVT